MLTYATEGKSLKYNNASQQQIVIFLQKKNYSYTNGASHCCAIVYEQ